MEFQEYFGSYKNYFWQWEEPDEVIAIPDGSTIAYRDYIIELLEHFTTQGFPPFGSLLLAIIATNRLYSDDIGHIYNTLSDYLIKNSSFTQDHSDALTDGIEFLKMLTALPPKYKEGKRRIQMLQTLFLNCHNSVASRKARQILRSYVTNKHGEGKIYLKREFNGLNFIKDFKTIALLHKTYPTAKSVIEKLAELPSFEENLLLDEAPFQIKEDNLIEQLISNAKTFHVGALVKRIWGGLNIPFHNSLPSQQPIGGVSDLTNKGDYDRLLISEFANDDLIFLSRLANNEALYINREVPPQDNDLERIILIDASIKNWGTPKIIAHALLLAIAKHPKTNIPCFAFGVGDHYYPFYFDTIDDIIDSLQILEASLNPAKGIESFLRDQALEKHQEVIFITAKETLTQRPLLKILNDYHSSFQYLLYIDENAGIDLYKKQQNATKHVQHLQLPLEDLWLKPAHQPEAKETEVMHSSYPILFPCPLSSKKIFKTDCGQIFQITAERNLMRLYSKEAKDRNKGWELIYEQLPPMSTEFDIGINRENDLELLMFRTQNRELLLLNLFTNKTKAIFPNELHSRDAYQFFFSEDFYAIGGRQTFLVANAEPEIKLTVVSPEKASVIKTNAIRKAEEIKTIVKEIWSNAIVLKNITEVYINEVGNLVFNIHELRVNEHGAIKLEKTSFLRKEFVATSTNQTEFVFDNGSSVKVNRSGMIVLSEFDKMDTYRMFLTSSGSSKMDIIKILKDELGFLLKEAKEAVDSQQPYLVKEGLLKADAERLKFMIRAKGGEVKISYQNSGSIYVPSVLSSSLGVATNNSFSGNPYYQLGEGPNMKPELFWKKYITPFIQHVKGYGA